MLKERVMKCPGSADTRQGYLTPCETPQQKVRMCPAVKRPAQAARVVGQERGEKLKVCRMTMGLFP